MNCCTCDLWHCDSNWLCVYMCEFCNHSYFSVLSKFSSTLDPSFVVLSKNSEKYCSFIIIVVTVVNLFEHFPCTRMIDNISRSIVMTINFSYRKLLVVILVISLLSLSACLFSMGWVCPRWLSCYTRSSSCCIMLKLRTQSSSEWALVVEWVSNPTAFSSLTLLYTVLL